MFSPNPEKPGYVLWLFCLLLALPGCGENSESETPESTAARERSRPAVRVQVARVDRGQLAVQPRATGMSRAFRRAVVAAEFGGRVVERAAEPGDIVEAGDALLILDQERPTFALNEAKASLDTRGTDLAEAEREFRRGQNLAKEEAISERELDRMRATRDRASAALALAEARHALAERDLADATVRAPFAGTVERIDSDVGDFVQRGNPVAIVVDLSRVRVKAGVTAAEAARLETGSRAVLRFNAGSGKPRSGTIRSVGRMADVGDGTFPVEIWLENSEESLRDGMTAMIEFEQNAEAPVALIPRAALARKHNAAVVFVVEGQGEIRRAKIREVRLGRSDDTQIEVISGLSSDETVIVDGQFAIDDGALVIIDDATRG